ncbi:alkaline phosphatase family protein [Kitasatospora sp. MMS16-BH015]|uniref:alkaline phosphatase family protein n=1 Tax=Kitasatospora sp. MMS16-BH015 TaxID=2018025 RepID=UPI000CF2F1A8|nr:alkaline phosphatase family protein [Kitasatospora sp. MMS16-BH015]
MRTTSKSALFFAAAALVAAAAAPAGAADLGAHAHRDRHVLLISIDGLHAGDLATWTAEHPGSALAQLARRGTTYTNARSSEPSDSFPGIVALTTGGSPKTTGVYYDDSYDRTLSPAGSGCKTVGTEVVFDESVDRDATKLDAGGGIDPAKLPLDPRKGCTPVYPHSFLRTNTVFEVARSAGLTTAWADKHPAYDLLNGPSGRGVEDAFDPEIAATDGTVPGTIAYDALKVAGVRNQIDGRDHTGRKAQRVPAVFGLNFQAVSVAQKTAGYAAKGAFSPELGSALAATDAAIGGLTAELKAKGLDRRTEIVLSAKHGQSPVDRSERKIVDKKLLDSVVNGVRPGLLAQGTADDVALLWLTDGGQAQAVAAALRAHAAELNIDKVLVGPALLKQFGNPAKDARTPDVIVLPKPGTIYAKPTATKLAEHGGFTADDTHVALLVAGPGRDGERVTSRVETTQVAPTILQFLGLNPRALDAVRLEGTRVLPDAR